MLSFLCSFIFLLYWNSFSLCFQTNHVVPPLISTLPFREHPHPLISSFFCSPATFNSETHICLHCGFTGCSYEGKPKWNAFIYWNETRMSSHPPFLMLCWFYSSDCTALRNYHRVQKNAWKPLNNSAPEPLFHLLSSPPPYHIQAIPLSIKASCQNGN